MSTQGYADTLAQVLVDTIGQLPAVSVPLNDAIGRRLAADLVTKHPSPRFDNSQMDGYGIGYANVAGGRFRVGPDVPAGADPADIYHYGVNGYGHDTAVPIMTGAKIPEDVVAIVPVEQADPPQFVSTGEYVDLPAVEVGAFIRKTGSDMPARTRLARENTLVDAALVAVAASQGIAELSVTARPTIAVVAGGDEVVAGTAPRSAQILDANTPLIRGFAKTHGMDVIATERTTDELRNFQTALDRLIDNYAPDIIITSGGISEGKFEVVRQLLDRLTVSWVGKLSQQPGGPQGYGVYGRTPLIALPGNPVSTWSRCACWWSRHSGRLSAQVGRPLRCRPNFMTRSPGCEVRHSIGAVASDCRAQSSLRSSGRGQLAFISPSGRGKRAVRNPTADPIETRSNGHGTSLRRCAVRCCCPTIAPSTTRASRTAPHGACQSGYDGSGDHRLDSSSCGHL